ncbi:MAG TPA: GTP cyclohydrolase I [Anaeromyxobacteraceae bacterium]|nr:GTP cyclohydrolase I [Anaeromyxobacteraceae bacterium]
MRSADAAASAISRFLDALVPAAARRHPDLDGTPARVAAAWADDLLDGYRQDPGAILSEAMPARGGDLVAVTGIDFHSMCPHHLLPSRGVAHVGYVPGRKVVGFGQIARLVDCFAHRLVLEEDLARHVAEAIVRHLGARGAACVLDAEQSCLTVRGERRPRARAHAQCFLGTFRRDAALQRRFLGLAESANCEPRSARNGGSGAEPPDSRAAKPAARLAERASAPKALRRRSGRGA